MKGGAARGLAALRKPCARAITSAILRHCCLAFMELERSHEACWHLARSWHRPWHRPPLRICREDLLGRRKQVGRCTLGGVRARYTRLTEEATRFKVVPSWHPMLPILIIQRSLTRPATPD